LVDSTLTGFSVRALSVGTAITTLWTFSTSVAEIVGGFIAISAYAANKIQPSLLKLHRLGGSVETVNFHTCHYISMLISACSYKNNQSRIR
jgi:TRAP-type mannitol/chloroaromatic compound transport system substrate-binding protein